MIRIGEIHPLTGTTDTTNAMAPHFRKCLLRWFDVNARDLPWRRTHDPYRIWLSEIMLQQTRVAAVLEHYAEFLRRFPTLKDLAAAHEAHVLAAWSGLGYYRRVRMMHQAARQLVAEHGAIIPKTAKELRKLSGIGEYTSAAIASIAFGEAIAVVDGNVERVTARLRGLDGRSESATLAAAIRASVNQLLDPGRPGDFNQAMMELGATVCLPRNPLCLSCPVQAMCATRGEHPTLGRKPMQSRDVAYALVQRRQDQQIEILLEQRSSTVMGGMWELPEMKIQDAIHLPILKLRHAIMQTSYRVSICPVTPQQAIETCGLGGETSWWTTRDLHSLPLTGLARKVLKRMGLLAAREVTAAPHTELKESPFSSVPV